MILVRLFLDFWLRMVNKDRRQELNRRPKPR